jgi:hypothetical protein
MRWYYTSVIWAAYFTCLDSVQLVLQDDFDFQTAIAKGAFGTVYRAVRKCEQLSCFNH